MKYFQSNTDNKNYYIKVVAFTTFICILLILKILFDINFFKYIHLLVLIFCGIFFLNLYLYKIKTWCMPFFMFQLVAFVFFAGGLIIYYLRDTFYVTYEKNLIAPTIAYIIIIVASNFAYYIPQALKKKNKSLKILSKITNIDFDIKRIIIILSITIPLSYISAYKLFGGFANAPLFSDNIDLARFRLAGTSRGYLWFGLFSAFHSVTLLVAIASIVKKDIIKYILLLITFIISIFPLILYGGRSFVLIPILISVFFITRTKNISFSKVIFLFIIIFIFAIQLFGMLRTYDERVISSSKFLHYIFTATFPEVRTIANISEKISGHEVNSKPLYSFLAATLPKILFTLFGLDKSEFNIPIGAAMSSYDPDSIAGQGYRTTLLGEIYLLHDYLGILIWGLCIGLLFYILDNRCIYIYNKPNIYNYNASYNIVLPMAAIPYGTTFISTIVWLYIQLFLINIILKKKI